MATELDTARLIASGQLSSPTRVGNFDLWAVRITGTGRAERDALNETVWRDPGTWLSDETLARCAGLPVCVEHPRGGVLNSADFAARVVGSVLFAYVADAQGIGNDSGPDLWAI